MDILRRIDVALLRMEKAGHKDTAHYNNLKDKREHVAYGAEYAAKDVTEENIKSVGGLFAVISRLYRLRPFNTDFK